MHAVFELLDTPIKFYHNASAPHSAEMGRFNVGQNFSYFSFQVIWASGAGIESKRHYKQPLDKAKYIRQNRSPRFKIIHIYCWILSVVLRYLRWQVMVSVCLMSAKVCFLFEVKIDIPCQPQDHSIVLLMSGQLSSSFTVFTMLLKVEISRSAFMQCNFSWMVSSVKLSCLMQWEMDIFCSTAVCWACWYVVHLNSIAAQATKDKREK